MNESGITKTVDPFGGSYYLEELTSELIEKLRSILRKLNPMEEWLKPLKWVILNWELKKLRQENKQE